MITAFFVYGTLQRDHCRSGLWPAEPLSIQQAWAAGMLFSRHDYPAMTVGEDRIQGELWRFPGSEVQQVIATLDQIEGTNQPGEDDLYRRVVAESWSLDGEPLGNAYVYHYATDPIGDGFVRVKPANMDAFLRWLATSR